MKKRFMILAAAISVFFAASAQQAPDNALRERIYLQTDKQVYLYGELVWMKLITTDHNGVPVRFSKIGYVELLDASTSQVQAKIEIPDGVGGGSIVLPSVLPSGNYRLVAYTRYMRNEFPG